MPVKQGKDSKGPYFRWGSSGAKYYFTAGNPDSRKKARDKASKQGKAAHASGYGGK